MDIKILKRELDLLKNEFSELKGQLNQGPLRMLPPGLSLKEIFWCRSNEDGPSDRRYIYADLLDDSGLPIVEGEGHNIIVHFTVYAPDDKNLNECVPFVKEDPEVKWPLPIIKRPVDGAEEDYQWWCFWPANISQGPCLCDPGEEE